MQGWILRLRRSLGEGNDNPLQYSCLKSSMDRGAWQSPWGYRVWHEWAINTLFKYATSTCCETVQKAGNLHSMSKGCHSLSKAIPTAEVITQLRVTWKPSRNQFPLTKLCLPHGVCFSNLLYATLISNPFFLVWIWSQPSNFLPSFPAKHVKWLHLKYSRSSFKGSWQCQIWLHWMSNHSMSG